MRNRYHLVEITKKIAVHQISVTKESFHLIKVKKNLRKARHSLYHHFGALPHPN